MLDDDNQATPGDTTPEEQKNPKAIEIGVPAIVGGVALGFPTGFAIAAAIGSFAAIGPIAVPCIIGYAAALHYGGRGFRGPSRRSPRNERQPKDWKSGGYGAGNPCCAR